jgi:pantetheine-phosphate adenylyltransferase
MTTAVYAGSFDPMTLGHVSVVRRGLRVCDRVIVAVACNSQKTPFFSLEERLDVLRQEFARDPGVEIDTFQGLLVEYARARQAQVILRGLRGVADFEYELQMTHMNRKLAPEIETVFIMTEKEHSFVSSRLVKEVASLHGDIAGTVTDDVARRLIEKFQPR